MMKLCVCYSTLSFFSKSNNITFRVCGHCIKMCDCKLDYPDTRHWADGCFFCGYKGLIAGPICDCQSQCGHLFGMRCSRCSKAQLPKTGNGWCKQVRIIKRMMKPGDTCLRKGCKNHSRRGYDYCSIMHAKRDGFI